MVFVPYASCTTSPVVELKHLEHLYWFALSNYVDRVEHEGEGPYCFLNKMVEERSLV